MEFGEAPEDATPAVPATDAEAVPAARDESSGDDLDRVLRALEHERGESRQLRERIAAMEQQAAQEPPELAVLRDRAAQHDADLAELRAVRAELIAFQTEKLMHAHGLYGPEARALLDSFPELPQREAAAKALAAAMPRTAMPIYGQPERTEPQREPLELLAVPVFPQRTLKGL